MKGRITKKTAMGGLVMGLVLAAPLQADEIYKWVDGDGVTHYSQQPPPSGDAARVRVDSPPADEIERERQQMEATGERLEVQREQRREAEQEARESATDREQREQRCAGLRSSLTKLTENRRLLVPDGEEGVRRLSEGERQERVAERRSQIEEYCD